MRKLITGVLAFSIISSGVAHAHQPVVLLESDKTAATGPLLVDGTLSFAVRASFTKAGQKKAFRAQFKKGEALTVQYLIVDKKPENAPRNKSLPTLVITDPAGSKVTMKFTERTKFYEPYSGVNYLYLGRYNSEAQSRAAVLHDLQPRARLQRPYLRRPRHIPEAGRRPQRSR